MSLFPMTRQEANFVECAVFCGSEAPDRDEDLVARMIGKLDAGLNASAFEEDELMCLVDCFEIGFNVGGESSGFSEGELEDLKSRVCGLIVKPEGIAFH